MGQWKNYEELEESLCFEELLATINAMREKELREQRFLAALQGVDIDSDSSAPAESSKGDIADLKGYAAVQEGFGIGMGLGFAEVDHSNG